MSSTPRRLSRKRKRSDFETPVGQSRITDHFRSVKTPRRTLKALTLCKPDSIVCREKELSILRDYLTSHLQHKTPGSLYISGPPGTGKTLCVTEVLGDDGVRGAKVVKVNCMSLKTPKAIFGSLGEELLSGKGSKSGSKSETVEMHVEKVICTSAKMIVVVLEEVDQLSTTGREQVLQTLFTWPTLKNSKLILIGISNSLDLTDRALPRLKKSHQPTILQFKPYDKEEIAAILTSRLGEMTNEIHPVALKFCAAKVAAHGGDVRNAINICRTAIEAADGNLVKVREIDTMMKSERDHMVEDISSSWPLQHKIVTCTLLRSKENRPTMAQLYDSYQDICQRKKLNGESMEEFMGMLGLLEVSSVVTIENKGKKIWGPTQRKVWLKMNKAELEHKIQDKTLISSILSD